MWSRKFGGPNGEVAGLVKQGIVAVGRYADVWVPCEGHFQNVSPGQKKVAHRSAPFRKRSVQGTARTVPHVPFFATTGYWVVIGFPSWVSGSAARGNTMPEVLNRSFALRWQESPKVRWKSMAGLCSSGRAASRETRRMFVFLIRHSALTRRDYCGGTNRTLMKASRCTGRPPFSGRG